MAQTSSAEGLWSKFRHLTSDRMENYIPTKLLSGKKINKLWINRKIKSLMRHRDKLFRRIRKTKNGKAVRKYKASKRAVQKNERQSYWSYVNGIIKVGDPDSDRQFKQNRFWKYIKSLRKDATGIAPLKDIGRLFTRQRSSVDSTFRYTPRRTKKVQFQSLTATLIPRWESFWSMKKAWKAVAQ